MKNLTPKEAQQKLEKERDTICFIDVRSEDEFRSGHVPGAMCMPLDKIENNTVSIPENKLVVLSCQSGKRSAKAKEILAARGLRNVIEMEGGYSAWLSSGLPINRFSKAIPIMRQVLLTAGIIVFISTILGITVHTSFLAVPIFMGAGLTFAGATGWCGLAFLLERMPWNRSTSS